MTRHPIQAKSRAGPFGSMSSKEEIMNMRKKFILLAIFLTGFIASAASAAPYYCYVIGPDGNGTNWITPPNGLANPPAWLGIQSGATSITPPLKVKVKFNSGSGYVANIYKYNQPTSISSLLLPFTAAWDGSIHGPAKLIVSSPSGKCSADFEIAADARESVDLPKPTVDNAAVDSTISVGGVETIKSMRVSVWLTHPQDSELSISLIGPDGTTINLSSGNGGLESNYGITCNARTIFDDNAGESITSLSVSPPYWGRYAPEQPLAAFTGKSGAQVNGNWTLRVNDAAGGFTGTIHCWGLSFED